MAKSLRAAPIIGEFLMQNHAEEKIARFRKIAFKIYLQNVICHFSDVKNWHKKYHHINKSYFDGIYEVLCS